MLKKIFSSKNLKGALKESIETIVFVVVMVIIIRFFIGEIRWIPSSSMEPTLTVGDRLFIERATRFYKKPTRGDIVVFYPPMTQLQNTPLKVFQRLTGFFCKDIAYIKRIVAKGGDKVEVKKVKDNKYKVVVNGKELKEDYILNDFDYIECNDKMYCGPMTVPEGHYFLLGDNRGNSQDSRFWGFLKEDRVIGRAIVIFWPLNRLRMLNDVKF